MRLIHSDTSSTDFVTASAAVVKYLKARPRDAHGQPELAAAASVAEAIWPGNAMSGQGAGGAASRILKRMETNGVVMWTARRGQWGWRLRSGVEG
jgi:hypothetical protein